METKEQCEEKGGTWMEDENGVWMCKHPETAEETSDTSSDDSVGM